MDRLYLVIAVSLLAVGCDDKPKAQAPTPTPSRVDAVVAKKAVGEKPRDFCDVYHDSRGAAEFQFPELDGEVPAPAEGWRWVNVWATWCEPCMEEMPRLNAWKSELAEKGLGDVVFVSADDAPALKKFQAAHPDTPATARLGDPAALKEWVNGLGLVGDPSLPVHIFVDPAGKARCLRMGGVSDHDRPSVERLLK